MTRTRWRKSKEPMTREGGYRWRWLETQGTRCYTLLPTPFVFEPH